MRLLVIEPAPEKATSLTNGLRPLGYRVAAAATRDYRELLESGIDYDTILIDLEAAGDIGLLLLHEFREAFPAARILVLSPSGEIPDRVLSLIQGADEILVKPFDLAGLHGVLQDGSRHDRLA